MAGEELPLLLRDLCARLPYGVKCNVWYGPKSPALYEKDKYTDDILETVNPKKGNCTFHNAIGYDFGFFPVEHVKPYLRPLSSMTEEEKIELCTISYAPDEMKTIDKKLYVIQTNAENAADFYNKHHFDYRELIPKGLALEAKKEMYKEK